MVFEFTDDNFEAKATQGVTVIDFWAAWCGPCKTIGPIIEELADDFKDKALIGKMDVDNNEEIPLKYGVRAIPTVLFLKNGKLVDKQVGLATKKALQQKLEAAIAVNV
jgi:thioredoxin 1